MMTKGKQINGWASEVYCLSTDTKPTENVLNGASCIEIDTGKFYLFNGDSKTWVLQCSLQG